MPIPTACSCNNDDLNVTLNDGRRISVPIWWYPKLLSATPSERQNISFSPLGVHWPLIDEDISVDSLLRGERGPGVIDPAIDTLDFRKIGQLMQAALLNEEMKLDGLQDIKVASGDYRDLIHNRVHSTYHPPKSEVPNFKYRKFFAATDTLIDLANILNVAEKGIWPIDESAGKLWMYGAMQALAVQQDALVQLLKCFGLGIDQGSEAILAKVRELRVASVGHPSDHNRTKIQIKGATWLGQRDFSSKSCFKICTIDNGGLYVERTLNIPKLIREQQTAVQSNLRHIWDLVKNNPRFDPPK